MLELEYQQENPLDMQQFYKVVFKEFFFANCPCKVRIFIQQCIVYLWARLICTVVWNMPNPWTASWPDPTPPNQQTHCRFHQKSSIQSSGSIYINNELIYNVHVFILKYFLGKIKVLPILRRASTKSCRILSQNITFKT